MTTKEKTIERLTCQRNVIETDLGSVTFQVKNFGKFISIFQLRIYKKRRALLNKQLKQINIQIDCLTVPENDKKKTVKNRYDKINFYNRNRNNLNA